MYMYVSILYVNMCDHNVNVCSVSVLYKCLYVHPRLVIFLCIQAINIDSGSCLS